MTNRPDLSVIIPMHNASATVTGVVESFLANRRGRQSRWSWSTTRRPTTRSSESPPSAGPR